VRIDHLDHLVLTVADLDVAIHFYSSVLGMQATTFGDGRKAVTFGNQKINFHLLGREFDPKAANPTSGSGDLCFVTTTPLAEVQAHLCELGVAIEEGPVERTGATGDILSVYLRDPDGNLIEIANYEPVAPTR
jgi:catechol 2,3-dioxygenase-like lactoylglutathione lyase family enzyme